MDYSRNRTASNVCLPSSVKFSQGEHPCDNPGRGRAESGISPSQAQWPARALTLLFLTLLCTCVSAQNTLTLTIQSRKTNQPLAATEIFAQETGQVYTTGRKGVATIVTESPTLTLTILATGFSSRQEIITFSQPGQTVTIQMVPLQLDLAAVTVLAEGKKKASLTRLRAVEGTAIYAGKKTEVVRLD
ncbi:MAG: Fe(3+) dicitrate transport protein, partial [Bdellovibrionota bacterium]